MDLCQTCGSNIRLIINFLDAVMKHGHQYPVAPDNNGLRASSLETPFQATKQPLLMKNSGSFLAAKDILAQRGHQDEFEEK